MNSPQSERCAILGWAIIELKIAYYYPTLVHESWHPYVFRPDAVYDGIEDEYRKLTAQLGQNPSAADMVGADFEKPSCRLALTLISKPKSTNICAVEQVLDSKAKKK